MIQEKLSVYRVDPKRDFGPVRKLGESSPNVVMEEAELRRAMDASQPAKSLLERREINRTPGNPISRRRVGLSSSPETPSGYRP